MSLTWSLRSGYMCSPCMPGRDEESSRVAGGTEKRSSLRNVARTYTAVCTASRSWLSGLDDTVTSNKRIYVTLQGGFEQVTASQSDDGAAAGLRAKALDGGEIMICCPGGLHPI